MKNYSINTGLIILGLGIAFHPLLSSITANATAIPVAKTETEPTIIWRGVTWDQYGWTYHREWSDGRVETSFVYAYIRTEACDIGNGGPQLVYFPRPADCRTEWVEVVPAPGGDGFACRADINGDRNVDGADLAFVLSEWGQFGGCSQIGNPR